MKIEINQIYDGEKMNQPKSIFDKSLVAYTLTSGCFLKCGPDAKSERRVLDEADTIYIHFKSLILARPSSTTINLPLDLPNESFGNLNSSSGSVVNVLDKITPFVDFFSLKISSPKSLPPVTNIIFSFSANARILSPGALHNMPPTNKASYPWLFRAFENLVTGDKDVIDKIKKLGVCGKVIDYRQLRRVTEGAA